MGGNPPIQPPFVMGLPIDSIGASVRILAVMSDTYRRDFRSALRCGASERLSAPQIEIDASPAGTALRPSSQTCLCGGGKRCPRREISELGYLPPGIIALAAGFPEGGRLSAFRFGTHMRPYYAAIPQSTSELRLITRPSWRNACG